MDVGKDWGLFFLRSPVEIISDGTSGRVARIKIEINKLEVRGHLQTIFGKINDIVTFGGEGVIGHDTSKLHCQV